MASSTFKSVSDTIRSKAQIFYVDTERPGTQLPTEATHSKKNEHRPSILSSLRSRTSRNRLNDDFQNFVTVAIQASDMSHELHVEIPDSTLLETMGLSRKETITDHACGNMHPAMVSPLEVASSRTSTDTTASPVSLKAFIAESNADAKQIKSHKPEDDAPRTKYNQNRLGADVSDDEGCGKDLRSVTDEGLPDISLNDKSGHIASSPPTTTCSTRCHLGGNLFVKGNREQTRKYGIPSPYRRALQLSEEAASESSTCISDGTNEIGIKSREDSVSSRLPLKLTTSISSGLSGLITISPARIQSASTAEIEVNSSEAYDADEEYGSERSEEPSMGPKSSWEKARADRHRRYQFVRSMSAETASDHSDVPSLELRPMRDESNAHNDASNLTPMSIPSAATPGNLRKVHFEPLLDPASFKQAPMPTSATTEHSTDAELESTDIQQEQNAANLEVPKQHSDLQRLLAVPLSYQQENSSPSLELQLRTCSAHSDTTSSSCAITTGSQLCYRPVLEESFHVRTHHPRRISSIIGAFERARHDLERSKPDNETPTPSGFNEDSDYPGINAATVIVRENTIRSPASVKNLLDSSANHSRPTTPSNTTTETTGPPLYNDAGMRSVFGVNKSGSFVENLCIEKLPPLPASGSTPYHEPWIDMGTHRSMPGAFEPSPEKQWPKLSLRNSQEDDTRKNTPNLFVAMSDMRPSSVDFSMMNPEVDHYLAQAFSDVPYRVTESEYSDEENGFRTPITTPIKRDYKATNRIGSFTDLGLPGNHSSDQAAVICQPCGTSNEFVAARLPKFAASPANEVGFPAGGKRLTSTDDDFSLDGVMLPKDITPPILLSGESHYIDRSWQIGETTCGGGEFSYHFEDSPHAQLQTSSLKKGVWWTRVQEMLRESESPCAERPKLQTLDDDLDNAKDTLRLVEKRMNESNMNINDMRALLGVEYTPAPRGESGSPFTERQIDGAEDDNPAMATERSLTVEKGIQQNRKTISDINALLATATPFVKEFVSGKSPDDIISDSKKDILRWHNGNVTSKYQVRSPPGSEDSLNTVDLVQQDQDADRLASLFSHSIPPLKGFKTLHQEIKASVESLQGEEMVISEESDMDIIGSLPHTIRRDRLRRSEDSWYSFEMD
ncbi:hypothetical protein MMC32_005613 [Xylographa parallela]|nr:hypothetical protein [Xylographa parallela]